MPTSPLCTVALSLVLAAPVMAADVLRVGGPDAVGAFFDVQSAVDAAAPGDVILVEAGVYPGFDVVATGIAVIARRGELVAIEGLVTVRDLPADEALYLDGLTFDPGDIPAGAVELTDCAGSVRFSACQLLRSLSMTRCPDVAVSHSWIQGDATGSECGYSTAGAWIRDSNLAFADGQVHGQGPCCSWLTVGAGIRIEGESYLFASNASFFGGGELENCGCWNVCGRDGESGLQALPGTDCDLVGVTLTGGLGSIAWLDGLWPCNLMCTGADAPPLEVLPGAVVEQLAGAGRSFTVSAMSLGDPVSLTFSGPAGENCWLRVARNGGFAASTAGLVGPDLLSGSVLELHAGMIPAGGELSFEWTPPAPAPGEAARVLQLQARFDGQLVSFLRGSAVHVVIERCADGGEVSRYCDAVASSSGSPARMDLAGSRSVSANDLVLTASSLPANHSALFVYSADPAAIPLGDGVLCLGTSTLGFVVRLAPLTSGPDGSLTHDLDLAAPPAPAATISPGETWYFSCWFRDVDAGGAGFNFADGLAIPFCP